MDTNNQQKDFYNNVIVAINKDLANKGFVAVETLLMHYKVREVFEILSLNSQTFHSLVKRNEINSENLLKYFELIVCKKNQLLDLGLNNIDEDYKKAKRPIFDQNRNVIYYQKLKPIMTSNEIFNILELLKMSLKVFKSLYENELIIGNLHNGDRIYLELKASQLLHILGITKAQVTSNPDIMKVLNLSSSVGAYQILEAILEDFDKDKRLIDLADSSLTEILPFNKIRLKTTSFIKYGPFDKIKLMAKLHPDARLTPHSKSNMAVLSNEWLSHRYDWIYLGGVIDYKKMYTETLLIDSSYNQQKTFSNQKAELITSIGTESSRKPYNVFSIEEQFEFIRQIITPEDGGEPLFDMDFTEIIDYFREFSMELDSDKKEKGM